MAEIIKDLHPWLQGGIKALLLFLGVLSFVPIVVWWERRLLAWMQDRLGPNRVGPFGLFQPIADGVKLFFKEDIVPASVDKLLYYISPMLAMFPAFILGGTLPWGPTYGFYGLLTPVADVDIGVLYFLAVSSLGAYGVVLSGYAAKNKYSLIGGLRGSAQLISYELAMTMSLACIVLETGSLKLSDMVIEQAKPLWDVLPYLQNWFILTPFGFVAGVVFLICMVAETNRAPFDLPECENELVAGYHTEYSSMKFAIFFMSEYAAMFVFSGIFSTVFLGGYNLLPIRWEELASAYPVFADVFNFCGQANYWLAPAWFVGKCLLGMTFYIWVRATLPRLRYDQLMALGWKSLLPLAVINFIVVAIWQICKSLYGVAGGFIAVGLALMILFILYMNIVSLRGDRSKKFERRKVRYVDSGEINI